MTSVVGMPPVVLFDVDGTLIDSGGAGARSWTHAAMLHGHDVTPDRVFVVGDTPLDVEAARAVGAVSVAVASGKFSVEELRSAGARHVLPRWPPGSPR